MYGKGREEAAGQVERIAGKYRLPVLSKHFRFIMQHWAAMKIEYFTEFIAEMMGAFEQRIEETIRAKDQSNLNLIKLQYHRMQKRAEMLEQTLHRSKKKRTVMPSSLPSKNPQCGQCTELQMELSVALNQLANMQPNTQSSSGLAYDEGERVEAWVHEAKIQEARMYWERSMMARQDIAMLKYKIHQIKKQVQQQENIRNNKRKVVVQKTDVLNQRIIAYDPNVEVLLKQLQNFDQKFRLFKRKYHRKINHLHFSVPADMHLYMTRYSSLLKNFNYMDLCQETQKIALKDFQYGLPSPLIFLQERWKTLTAITPNPFSDKQKIRIETFVRMRAILDAKTNEHLMVGCPLRYSRFGDFVYAWCEKYTVDSNTLTVVQNQNGSAQEDFQQFFFALFNERLNGVWEVITFRQFFLELAPRDQLTFYLRAKQLLFKGDVLRVDNHRFESLIFTKLQSVLEFLEVVLEQFDEFNKANAIKLVSAATRQHEDTGLVDSFFLLRVVVEYYRVERAQRLAVLRGLFSKIAVNKGAATFKQFMQLFSYLLTGTSTLQRLQLYRQCYFQGSGKISAQIFYVVLNEQNQWARQLRTLQDERICKFVRGKQAKQFCFDPPICFSYSLYDLYQSFNENSMRSLFAKLGLVQVPMLEQRHLETPDGILQGLAFFQSLNTLMFKRLAVQDFRITQFVDKLLVSNIQQLNDTLKSAEVIDKVFEKIKKKIVRRMEEAYVARKLGSTKKEQMRKLSRDICRKVMKKGSVNVVEELLKVLTY